MSFWEKVEANCGPLLEITLECSLNHGKTWQKKSRATPATSISLVQEQKIAPLVSSWSTTTMTESKPLDKGSPEIRLTEIDENWIGDLTVKGVNPGTME